MWRHCLLRHVQWHIVYGTADYDLLCVLGHGSSKRRRMHEPVGMLQWQLRQSSLRQCLSTGGRPVFRKFRLLFGRMLVKYMRVFWLRCRGQRV